MTSQNIPFLKTKKFIETYPNIALFQHNNLSVKQWSELRIELKKIKNIRLFVVKNNLIRTIYIDNKNIGKLFQGPCFAIGFFEEIQLQEILEFTKKFSNICLLGGMFGLEVVTHLDILKYVDLGNVSVYPNLLFQLSQNSKISLLLQNSINFQVLHEIPLNLIYCLEALKTKQKDNYCICLNIRVNPTAGSPTVTLLRLRSSYYLHYGISSSFFFRSILDL